MNDVVKPKTVRACVAAVSQAFRISPERLRGDDRAFAAAHPRQVVYWLARNQGYSAARIGRYMNRDHSSVFFGIRAAERRYDEDDEFGDKMQAAFDILEYGVI